MHDDALKSLLEAIEASFADHRLADDEKSTMTRMLRAAPPSEESLRQLRNRAFTLVRERAHVDRIIALKWLEAIVRMLDVARTPVQPVQSAAFFSPGTECLNAILAQLRNAKKSVDLCVFTISDDRIAEGILEAVARGVEVRLITDNDKEHDLGSDIARLRSSGVRVVVDRTEAHMHHKFAIVDGTWLINGSYNWTRSASTVNEENIVLTNDPSLVRAFADQFEALGRALV